MPEGEKKYLKSQLEHLGVSMPGIRRIAKAHAFELRSHDKLVAAAGSENFWIRSLAR